MNTAGVLVDYREVECGELAPLFLLGRPLWAATLKSTKGINLEILKSFARRKLYGGATNPELYSSLAARLVPFAVFANLKVAPTNPLGGDLVASHMATLIGVSED